MSAHVRSSCLYTGTDWHPQHLLTRCQAFDVSKIALILFDPLKMPLWLLSCQIPNLRSNLPNPVKIILEEEIRIANATMLSL